MIIESPELHGPLASPQQSVPFVLFTKHFHWDNTMLSEYLLSTRTSPAISPGMHTRNGYKDVTHKVESIF